jgi:hypothetical protein
MIVLGLGVWLTRRTRRWWLHGSTDSNSTELASIPARLDAWGFRVVRPGGDWVRAEAPGVFLPADAVVVPACGPGLPPGW